MIWRRDKASVSGTFSAIFCILLSSILGCGGDTTGPAPLASTQVFWALEFNYHAINMALTPPYNTVRLIATPRNAAGTVLTGTGRIHFTVRNVTDGATDSTVTVDSTGLVTAKYESLKGMNFLTQVVATLTMQGITHSDTAIIQVTASPIFFPLATFAFPHNSLRKPLFIRSYVATNGDDSPLITALDARGDSIPFLYYVGDGSGQYIDGLLTSCRSSDESVVGFQPYSCVAVPYGFGSATLYASTWAYGVLKEDSVQAQMGYGLCESVSADSYTPINSLTRTYKFDPPQVAISVGGAISFSNPNGTLDSVDVTFDDPAGAQVGNFKCEFFKGISAGGNIQSVGQFYDRDEISHQRLNVRTFPKAGIYRYHSKKYGANGVIVVSDTIISKF